MAYKTPAALYKMVPVEEALEVRDRPEKIKKQKKAKELTSFLPFPFSRGPAPHTCPTVSYNFADGPVGGKRPKGLLLVSRWNLL